MTSTIDLEFLGIPKVIAAFLLPTSEGPALVETGPHSTFEHLGNAINLAGFAVEDVKHVFLTHIHLDHAGAAWAFAKHGARIYVHPFGAKHLIGPEKLMDSARRIYQDQMDRLWGQMNPIDESLVVTVEDGQKVSLGSHQLVAHHTPGHARHHIAWQLDSLLFTGDVAGVKIDNGPVVAPCPPPDIDIDAWRHSIRLIRDLGPEKLMLTHFDAVTDVAAHLDLLDASLEDWSLWIKNEMDKDRSAEEITPDFTKYTANQLHHHGVNELGIKQYEAANPAWMSVAGLMRYWSKKST